MLNCNEVVACIAGEALPVSVRSNVAVEWLTVSLKFSLASAFTTLPALSFISPLYTVSALNYAAKAAHMAALGLNS